MKYKQLKDLSKQDREKKLKELQMELIKQKVNASNTGGSKARQIKRIIARINTLNASEGGLSNK
jgi:ribosomal protein L29